MTPKPRDQKLTILRWLSDKAEPSSMADIQEQLGQVVSGRTVRRWVAELIHEGLVRKIGVTKDARYAAVASGAGDSNAVSGCFGTESLTVVQRVRRPLFERQPVAYNLHWLESYRPNETFYLAASLRNKLAVAGQRMSEHDPAGTYAHQIFNRLLIDLSYNSSRLEGNTYSLLDTERLLLHGDSALDKLDEEKVMILNHKEAIRYLVDNAARITLMATEIFTLHYLLADGLVEPKQAGKVRDHGVRIGGSTYMPFDEPKRLETLLGAIASKAIQIRDPFEQSLFTLAHLSYLQAFSDVNKRTARLSANVPLVKNNLVPLSFNDVEVDDYMLAMIAIYELNDIRPLVDLYVYSYLRTCAAYDSTVKAMGFDEVRVRYRSQRRTLIRTIIGRGIVGAEIDRIVRVEAPKVIPVADREAFIEDLHEDLELIDESRLVGLGITPEQLRAWKDKGRPRVRGRRRGR